MELDKIIAGDSAVILQSFPPDCIDLTVTSPPYDNLRTYNGFTFDFETIARQLFRVTKAGGVVVWVVGDQTKKGSESGTSFKQALFFKEYGFNLHDTMIYHRTSMPLTHRRYEQYFEYMFVFSKGTPKTFNGIMEDVSEWVRERRKTKHIIHKHRNADGKYNISTERKANDKKLKSNVWYYPNKNMEDKIAYQHPAIFPQALARDHILTWSNEGDTVLDCFCGSGTTPKMAKLLNRHYIGIDTSAEYVALANERLAQLELGLTPLALDGGDSAPLQALSTPEVDSIGGADTTPPAAQ